MKKKTKEKAKLVVGSGLVVSAFVGLLSSCTFTPGSGDHNTSPTAPGPTTDTGGGDSDITTNVNIKYNVRFYNFDGTVLAETVAHQGQKLDISVYKPIDIGEGYEFTGWIGYINKTIITVKSNLNLTPTRAKKTLLIKFTDSNGDIISSFSVPYGETIPQDRIPNVPTLGGKPGTWYPNPFTTEAITKDMIFTPSYDESTQYTVTFVINGQKTYVSVPAGAYIDPTSIPQLPVEEGYKYSWDTSDIENLQINGPVTITAIKEAILHSVDFVLSIDPKTVLASFSVSHGASLLNVNIDNYIPYGYDLVGLEGGSLSNIVDDQTITIKVVAKTVEITVIDDNAVSNQERTIIASYGDNINDLIGNPTPVEGFNVTWEVDGKKTIDFNSLNVIENFTIRATKTPKVYTVAYYLDNTYINAVSVNHGSICNIPSSSIPEQPGKQFAGWEIFDNADSSLNGTMLGTRKVTGDLKVRAVYTDATYTVTFVGQNGQEYKESVAYGATYTLEQIKDILNDSSMVQIGYEYISYTILGSGAGDPLTSITNNMVIHGTYIEKQVSITYYDTVYNADGSINTVDSKKITTLTKKLSDINSYTPPVTPERTFKYWMTEDKTQITSTSDFIGKDAINVYANFETVQCTVMFTGNGKNITINVPYGAILDSETYKHLIPALSYFEIDEAQFGGWDRDLSTPITSNNTVFNARIITTTKTHTVTFIIKYTDKDGKDTIYEDKIIRASVPDGGMAQYPSSSELDKITQTSNFLVGKYLDDVNGIVTNVTADGTVVLTYRLNAYTINFMNANDTVFVSNTDHYSSDPSYTHPDNAYDPISGTIMEPEFEGYHFVRWDWAASGIDLTSPANNNGMSFTVRPVFEKDTYKVKIHDVDGNLVTFSKPLDGGGEVLEDYIEVVYGETTLKDIIDKIKTGTLTGQDAITLNDPGYNFVGLTYVANGKDLISLGSLFTPSGFADGQEINLYPYTTINRATVTFMTDSGNVLEFDTVKKGNVELYSPDYAKEGYDLIAWANGLDKTAPDYKEYAVATTDKKISISSIVDNITLYPVFKAQTYDVTFVDVSGNPIVDTSGDEFKVSAEYLENITSKVESLTGFKDAVLTLQGISLSESAHYVLEFDQSLDAIGGDIQVQVKAVKVKYDVSFTNSNGDSFGVQEVEYNDAPSALTNQPTVDPTRSGYEFAGWIIEGSADNKVYYFGTEPDLELPTGYTFVDMASLQVTGDVAFTAYFVAQKYEVIFKVQDETGAYVDYAKVIVTHGQNALTTGSYYEYDEASGDFSTTLTMGNVPEPVLEGKYFTGWDRLITFVTSSVTVKATYNSSTVKIEFRDPENGEAMLKEVSVNYNEASSTLVGPSITKEGYTFAGWVDANDNSLVYADDAALQAAKFTKNVVLHPVFTANSYFVELNYKDSTGADVTRNSNAQITFDTLISTDATIGGIGFNSYKGYTGYHITKWVDESGNEYDKDLTNILLNHVPAAGTTLKLTAVYESNTHTLTYKDRFGNILKTEEVTFGDTVNFSSMLAVPSVAGKTNAHWSDGTNTYDPTDLTGSFVVADNDYVLTATYDDVKVNVTVYEYDEVTKTYIPSSTVITLTYGEVLDFVKLPEPNAIAGKYFNNTWAIYDTANNTTTDVIFTPNGTPVISDIAIYPLYDNSIYGVTFTKEDGTVIKVNQVVSCEDTSYNFILDNTSLADGQVKGPDASMVDKAGYTLAGWKNRDDDSERYEIGKTHRLTHDIVLVPYYTQDVYQLNVYDANDNLLNTTAPIEIHYGDSILDVVNAASITIPDIAGKTFAEFVATGTNTAIIVDGIFKVNDHDGTKVHDVKVSYTDNKYTVEFIDGNGVTLYKDSEYLYDSSITIVDHMIGNTAGKTFLGYTLSGDASGNYFKYDSATNKFEYVDSTGASATYTGDIDAVSGLPKVVSDMVFNAKYDTTTYSTTLVFNVGATEYELSVNDIAYNTSIGSSINGKINVEGTDVTFTSLSDLETYLKDNTPKGTYFAGWAIDLNNGVTSELPEKVNAVYARNHYTFEFYIPGSTDPIVTSTVIDGNYLEVYDYNPAGSVFEGWYYSLDGENIETSKDLRIESGIITKVLGTDIDLTNGGVYKFVAKLETRKSTVNFYQANGNLITGAEQSGDYSADAVETLVPDVTTIVTPQGKYLFGWATASSSSDANYIEYELRENATGDMVIDLPYTKEDIRLYPVFKNLDYKFTFYQYNDLGATHPLTPSGSGVAYELSTTYSEDISNNQTILEVIARATAIYNSDVAFSSEAFYGKMNYFDIKFCIYEGGELKEIDIKDLPILARGDINLFVRPVAKTFNVTLLDIDGTVKGTYEASYGDDLSTLGISSNMFGYNPLNASEIFADKFTYDLYDVETSTSSVGNIAIGDLSTMTLTGDLTLTAQYTIRKSTVTFLVPVFNADGTIKEYVNYGKFEDVSYGSDAFDASNKYLTYDEASASFIDGTYADPEALGHKFIGWDVNLSAVTGDMVARANFITNTYRLEVETEDGTRVNGTSLSYYDTLSKLLSSSIFSVFDKTGYNLVGLTYKTSTGDKTISVADWDTFVVNSLDELNDTVLTFRPQYEAMTFTGGLKFVTSLDGVVDSNVIYDLVNNFDYGTDVKAFIDAYLKSTNLTNFITPTGHTLKSLIIEGTDHDLLLDSRLLADTTDLLSEIIINAVWETNVHTVSYYDSTNTLIKTESVKYGLSFVEGSSVAGQYTALDVPAIAGKENAGWSLVSGDYSSKITLGTSLDVTSAYTMPDNNISLYAVYQTQKLNVKFLDVDGNEITASEIDVEYGLTIGKANEPSLADIKTKTGYYWTSTWVDTLTNKIVDLDTALVTTDMILAPELKRDTYTITYRDENDKFILNQTVEFVSGSENNFFIAEPADTSAIDYRYQVLNHPTNLDKDYYNFVGWYDSEDPTKQYLFNNVTDEFAITSNVILKPLYVAKDYLVDLYDSEGNTFATGLTIHYGDSLAKFIEDNGISVPKINGMEFSGFAVKDDADQAVLSQFIPSDEAEGSLTSLITVYDATIYGVTFIDWNNVVVDFANHGYDDVLDYSSDFPTVTRGGFDFFGWGLVTEADPNGYDRIFVFDEDNSIWNIYSYDSDAKEYTATGETVLATDLKVNGSLSFRAMYRSAVYSGAITVKNKDGQEFKIDITQLHYQDKISQGTFIYPADFAAGFGVTDNPTSILELRELLKNNSPYGTEFAGYSTSLDTYVSGEVGDIYANYVNKKYTINYHLDSALGSDIHSSTSVTNGEYLSLINIAKPGYSFLGWSLLPDQTDLTNVFKSQIIAETALNSTEDGYSTGEFNLYPIFTQTTYDLTFLNYDGVTLYTITGAKYGDKVKYEGVGEEVDGTTAGETYIIPNRLGYVFTGWNGLTPDDDGYFTVSDNAVIRATYKAIKVKYEVYENGDAYVDGDTPLATGSVNYGTSIKNVTDAVINVPKGYILKKFNVDITSLSMDGKVIKDTDGEYYYEQVVSVYPIFEAIDYTINYYTVEEGVEKKLATQVYNIDEMFTTYHVTLSDRVLLSWTFGAKDDVNKFDLNSGTLYEFDGNLIDMLEALGSSSKLSEYSYKVYANWQKVTFTTTFLGFNGEGLGSIASLSGQFDPAIAGYSSIVESAKRSMATASEVKDLYWLGSDGNRYKLDATSTTPGLLDMSTVSVKSNMTFTLRTDVLKDIEVVFEYYNTSNPSALHSYKVLVPYGGSATAPTDVYMGLLSNNQRFVKWDTSFDVITSAITVRAIYSTATVPVVVYKDDTTSGTNAIIETLDLALGRELTVDDLAYLVGKTTANPGNRFAGWKISFDNGVTFNTIAGKVTLSQPSGSSTGKDQIIIRPYFEQITYTVTFKTSITNDVLKFTVNANDNASVKSIYTNSANKALIDEWLTKAINEYNKDNSHSIIAMNPDNYWYFEGSMGMSEKIDDLSNTGIFGTDITSDLVVCPLLEAEKVNIKVFYNNASGDINNANKFTTAVEKKLSFETSFLSGLGTSFFSSLVNNDGKGNDYHADVYSISGFVPANDDGSFAYTGTTNILDNLIKIEDFKEMTAIRSAAYRAYYVPVSLTSHFVFNVNNYKGASDLTTYKKFDADYSVTYGNVGFDDVNLKGDIATYTNAVDEQIFGYTILGFKRLNSTASGDLTSDDNYYYTDADMLARLKKVHGDDVKAIDLTTLPIDEVANGFNFEAIFVKDAVKVTFMSSTDAFYDANGDAQALSFSNKVYNLEYSDSFSKITDDLSSHVNAYNNISKFEIFNFDPSKTSGSAVSSFTTETLLKGSAILNDLFNKTSSDSGVPGDLYIRPVYAAKEKEITLLFDTTLAKKISDSSLNSYLSDKINTAKYTFSQVGTTNYYSMKFTGKYGASIKTLLQTLNDSLIVDFDTKCNGYDIDKIKKATIATGDDGETTITLGDAVTDFSKAIVNDTTSASFAFSYTYQKYSLTMTYYGGMFENESLADNTVLDEATLLAGITDKSEMTISFDGKATTGSDKQFSANETFEDFYDYTLNKYLSKLENTAIAGFKYKIGDGAEQEVLLKDFGKTYIRGAYDIKPIYSICRTKKVLIISEDSYKEVMGKATAADQKTALMGQDILMSFGASKEELTEAGYKAPTTYSVTGTYGTATSTYKQVYDYQISSLILNKLNTTSTIDPYYIINNNTYQNTDYNHRFTNVELGGKYGQYQLAGWNKYVVDKYVVLSPIWQTFGGLSAMSSQEAADCGITYTVNDGKVTITNVSPLAIGSTANLAWQHFNLTAAGTDTTSNGSFTVGFTEKYDTVSLPSFINGLPVTAITANALDPLGTSTAIVQTPDLAKGRIAGAFAKYIVLPENLEKIEDYTFGRIFNTSSVTIPRSVVDNNGITFDAFRDGAGGRYILMQNDQVSTGSLDSNARLFYYGHDASKGVLEYILTPYNFDYETSKNAAANTSHGTPTAGAYNKALNVAGEYAEKESGFRRLQAMLSKGFLQSDITPVDNSTRHGYGSRVDIKKFDISDYVVPDKIMATEVDFSMRFSSSLFYERELPQISNGTTTNYESPESLFGNEFSRSRWFATNGYSGIGLWAYRGDPFWDTPKWQPESTSKYTAAKTQNVPSDWWINLGDSGTAITASNQFTTQYNYDHYLAERAGMIYYTPGYLNWNYGDANLTGQNVTNGSSGNAYARHAQGVYKPEYRTTANRQAKYRQIFADNASRENSIARNALVIPTYVVMYDNEGTNWTDNYNGVDHKVEIRSVPGLPSDSNLYVHNTAQTVNSTGYRLPGSGLPFQSDYTRVGEGNEMLYLNGSYNNSWASSDRKLGLYMVNESYTDGRNSSYFNSTVTGYGTSSDYATKYQANKTNIKKKYSFGTLAYETTTATLGVPYQGEAASDVATGLTKASALAPTSYGSAEPTTPGGGGEGGAVGGGGEPLRYGYTGRGILTFSSWNDPAYAYSLGQINKGYNPLSNLEVVSTLNTLNIGRNSYWYNYITSLEKYNPKVYIGTPETAADSWIYDLQNTSKPPANQWPQNFGQSSQKGEANTEGLYGTEQFYGGASNPGYRVRKSMSTNMITYYNGTTWQFLIDNLYEYDYNI